MSQPRLPPMVEDILTSVGDFLEQILLSPSVTSNFNTKRFFQKFSCLLCLILSVWTQKRNEICNLVLFKSRVPFLDMLWKNLSDDESLLSFQEGHEHISEKIGNLASAFNASKVNLVS